MAVKASDLFVKALENEGVSYVFGVPGEENLDFLDSLSRSSIRFILTRHEQAAGFMAATYGRLTGKPGVCDGTIGLRLTLATEIASDVSEVCDSSAELEGNAYPTHE